MSADEHGNETPKTGAGNNQSKQHIPPTPTNSPRNTFFIQSAPNPPFLKSLSTEDVISFTHAYTHQSGGGVRELNDVYDVKTDTVIRGVLDQILAEYDDEKREINIRILRSQLKWPEDKPHRLQVKYFINNVKMLVTLKEMKDKRVEKQVLKITISKLPTRFEIDTDDYNQLHKLVSAAQKRLLDKDQYVHLQKLESVKKPGLEPLEQLLKLKQWAMNEHEEEIKMDEVMQVKQHPIHETQYSQQPVNQPAASTIPYNVVSPQPTQALATYTGQTPPPYHQSTPFQQDNRYPQTFQYHQSPQYILTAPQFDRSCRICSKPDHYQRDCPVNQMRRANGLESIFLRAQNNRNMPRFSPMVQRGGRVDNANAATIRRFNQHLQEATHGSIQSYQSDTRDTNRAQNITVRRFEGVN
eukprot:snap_masked-scaffold_3-processed-gene-11.34-mRNA-1 protein AED:1.00 eAED:1.00 QI:0/0/0/0/1/1/2/0/411